ncbi:glycosyltransferase [Escherichia coli]
MTRNDAELLKKCVISMLKTVTIEIQIYIVDNKSNDTRHCEILRELEQNNYNVEVIHKKNNLWILGVNDTIKLIKTRHSH